MPYLAFENAPQTSSSKTTCGAIESKIQESDEIATSKTSELLTKSTTSTQEGDTAQKIFETKYPILKLDADKITNAIAGRLATSLLGHVLFLKNQVPFPVMQLGRIPGGKTNTRASKQRAELLASYDTISSHLDTTFSALSTALARRAGHHSELTQVYLAILVGPSVITAKSKLILGIDGLEALVWGYRNSEPQPQEDGDSEDSEDDDDESEGSYVTLDGSEDGAEGSDGSGEGPEESEEVEEEEEDTENEEDNDVSNVCPNKVSLSPPPSTYISRVEEQKLLQNADRLLSRTLAAADVDGKGISSELSPTHTHILIHAPRRFNHPAWVPRQNATLSLDTALQAFQCNSGLRTGHLEEIGSRPKYAKKNPVEGVWITTRQGLHHPRLSQDTASAVNLPNEKEQEDDEMIWWSWDGKFQGFSDW